MANRKEYEMLFQLQAQLGSSFGSTFNSAQGQLASMQREIQELSRAQSDISAYQRQQSAVEATKKKLEVLQQQYDNIQREINETGEYSSDLENKLLSKQQQIERTSAALTRQTDRLDQMDTALTEAGIDTSNLTSESARLENEMSSLRKEQEEAAQSSQSFGEKSTEAFSAVSEAIAAAGIAAALKEIYEAYMTCVSAAADFEETMSSVEALSGASESELSDLTNMAKELGATTKFTANESAEAMTYMAMAGWDASEMLSGMNGVLQLAAASGEDLAMVSDIVTDSLSAFGLTAADTAHFSDVLAAAATNSNTNVSIMGETFKMSASVAGALGYSVEDVAVAVGLMANSGVKGSIAGTALKNTFNGLLEGVTLTSAAFGEYEYSAIKADGTMKDFSGTIDELRLYFDQMTEAERVNNAIAIAGQRGYNGLLAILNATDEDYASLTESINGCTGAAERMAAIKLDNANGELVLMQSAWEGLTISVGEQFTPAMAELYKVGQAVFSGLSRFVDENPALVKAVAAFAGVIGLVVAGISAYTAATKLAAIATGLLTTAVPGVGLIMKVAVAVAGVTAAVVAFTSASNESVPSVKELTEAAQEMQDAIAEASATYDETISSTMAAANVAENYISKLEALEKAGLDTEAEQQQYHNTLALLCETVPELANYIDLETDIIEGGTDALRRNTAAWKANAIAQAYQDQLTSLYASYADVLIEAEENSIGLTNAQYKLDEAERTRTSHLDRMNELMAEAQAAAHNEWIETGLLTDANAYLTKEYWDLEAAVQTDADAVWAAQEEVNAYTKAIDEDNDAVSEAQEAIDLATEAVNNLTQANEDGTETTALATEKQEEMAEIISDVAAQMENLAEMYEEAYEAAYDSIHGQYELWDETEEVVATDISKINSNLESQAQHWADYNANLEALSQRTNEIDGLREVIASFADGSDESVAAIAGMASASDADLQAMVENWLAVQAEQDNAATSIAEMATEFSDTMDQLASDLADDIDAMDLSEDAAAAAESTLSSYINSVETMLPQVQAAFSRVASTANRALSSTSSSAKYTLSSSQYGAYASGTNSADKGWAWVGENGPELAYFNGGETVIPTEDAAAMKIANGMNIPGYASGTISAAPGFAFVGENGPELVHFGGGERVYTAGETGQILNAAPAPIRADNSGSGIVVEVSFAPVYNISGAANVSDIQSFLAEHDTEMREYIREVVADATADAMRRAYS